MLKWNVQSYEFLQFDEENWKKSYRIISKKSIFSETHMEFDGRLAVSKLMDTQLTNQKFLQRMKEQTLKVSAS